MTKTRTRPKATQTVAALTLNAAVKGLIERLEKAEKFAIAELPNLCQEILREGEMDQRFDVIAFTLGTALLIAAAFLSYMRITGEESIGWILLCGVSTIGAIMTSVGSLCSLKELLLIKTAPKLYILSQLRRLARI